MNADLKKALVNAFNLNNYYSDSVSTNFTVEGGQIVCSFEGSPDAEKYIQEVGNEMIELFLGNKELAGRLFYLRSPPFNLEGAERIYDKDGRVKALKFDVTTEVKHNFKLLFAMAFMKSIKNQMKRKFEENPKATENQIEMIHAFVKSITIGRMGEPINDLYSIGLGGVESADPCMSKALKGIYVQILETQLENCGVDSSEFFELNDNVLSIKDITSVRIVNNIAEHTAGRVTFHFVNQGDKNSKVKNITDVFRREVFQLTKVNGKNGILIDGCDCDAFTDEDARDAGNDFALILKIEVSDIEVRDITREEADRINAAFRKKGFGDILIDVRGKTENTQSSKSQEPVYGIPNKKFARLIPELMKSPIAYNEKSGHFEYAVDLGNFYKLRAHSDLKADLDSILESKFALNAYDYVWQRLSESGFGCNGYSESDLEAEIEKYLQLVVRPSFLDVPTRAMGGSTGSLFSIHTTDSLSSIYTADSGCGTGSQSGSPERKRPKDSTSSMISGSNLSLAASETEPLHQGQYSFSPRVEEVVGSVSSESRPDPSSQQKSHGSFGRKTSKTIKAVITTVKERSAEHKQPPSTRTKNPSTEQHTSKSKSNNQCLIS